jgi:hypothetical protein
MGEKTEVQKALEVLAKTTETPTNAPVVIPAKKELSGEEQCNERVNQEIEASKTTVPNGSVYIIVSPVHGTIVGVYRTCFEAGAVLRGLTKEMLELRIDSLKSKLITNPQKGDHELLCSMLRTLELGNRGPWFDYTHDRSEQHFCITRADYAKPFDLATAMHKQQVFNPMHEPKEGS